MKVLHVIKSLEQGGAETLLLEMARRRHSVGLEIEVAYFLSSHRRAVPALEAAGVRVHDLGARSTVGMAAGVPALRRLVARLRPQIVHAHLPLAGVLARIVAARAGIPLVYTEHNVFSSYHPWTRAAALATWQLQAAVVAVSGEVAASLPVGPRVAVVRNGVDVERFAAAIGGRSEARRRFGFAEDEVVVGTVAVFRPAKRLDRFIDTVVATQRDRPHVRGCIVGYGPLEADLHAHARRVDVHGAVQFLGPIADPASFLAAIDIVLMPSSHEGLPLVLLESMAAGRPVIATPVGGIPEVVRDGVDGALCGVDQLKSTLLALVDSPDLRAGIGGRAAARAVEFGAQAMLRSVVDLYREVVG